MYLSTLLLMKIKYRKCHSNNLVWLLNWTYYCTNSSVIQLNLKYIFFTLINFGLIIVLLFAYNMYLWRLAEIMYIYNALTMHNHYLYDRLNFIWQVLHLFRNIFFLQNSPITFYRPLTSSSTILKSHFFQEPEKLISDGHRFF